MAARYPEDYDDYTTGTETEDDDESSDSPEEDMQEKERTTIQKHSNKSRGKPSKIKATMYEDPRHDTQYMVAEFPKFRNAPVRHGVSGKELHRFVFGNKHIDYVDVRDPYGLLVPDDMGKPPSWRHDYPIPATYKPPRERENANMYREDVYVRYVPPGAYDRPPVHRYGEEHQELLHNIYSYLELAMNEDNPDEVASLLRQSREMAKDMRTHYNKCQIGSKKAFKKAIQKMIDVIDEEEHRHQWSRTYQTILKLQDIVHDLTGFVESLCQVDQADYETRLRFPKNEDERIETEAAEAAARLQDLEIVRSRSGSGRQSRAASRQASGTSRDDMPPPPPPPRVASVDRFPSVTPDPPRQKYSNPDYTPPRDPNLRDPPDDTPPYFKEYEKLSSMKRSHTMPDMQSLRMNLETVDSREEPDGAFASASGHHSPRPRSSAPAAPDAPPRKRSPSPRGSRATAKRELGEEESPSPRKRSPSPSGRSRSRSHEED